LQSDGVYVDCTFGRGGHSQEILNSLGSTGRLLAFDQDPEAVQAAQAIREVDKRFSIIHRSFAQLSQSIEIVGQVNGVLLDLGVSSPQLDTPSRGFSFMRDGPLDMRMNPEIGESVAQWLSNASTNDIAEVLKTYGEERFARRIAYKIVATRDQKPLNTTHELADIIARVYPPPKKGKRKELKHPATRSFQALRIFINHELEQLQQVLPQVLDVLAPGGRLVVISFHYVLLVSPYFRVLLKWKRIQGHVVRLCESRSVVNSKHVGTKKSFNIFNLFKKSDFFKNRIST